MHAKPRAAPADGRAAIRDHDWDTSGPYRAAFDRGQHWESNRADARPSGQDPARPDFGPDWHVCSDVGYDIILAIYDIMHSVHDIITI